MPRDGAIPAGDARVDGGPSELVGAGNGQGLFTNDGEVYWIASGATTVDDSGAPVDLSPFDGAMTQFGVVGDMLYFRELGGIAQVRIQQDVEAPVGFAHGLNPLGLKSDGEYLYWFDVEGAPGDIRTTIRRKALGSPVAPTVEEAEPGEPLATIDRPLAPFAFEVAGDSVYFAFYEAESGTPAAAARSRASRRRAVRSRCWPPDSPIPRTSR